LGGQRVNAPGAEAGRWAIRGSLSAGRRLAGKCHGKFFLKLLSISRGVCLFGFCKFVRGMKMGKRSVAGFVKAAFFFTEIQPRKLVNRIA
jgi:hypothetical protein